MRDSESPGEVPSLARCELSKGIGIALEEESVIDQKFGRFMSHNLRSTTCPVNAHVHESDVIFVEEYDSIVGTAAAIANALFHATGVRIRELPIRCDDLLWNAAAQHGREERKPANSPAGCRLAACDR